MTDTVKFKLGESIDEVASSLTNMAKLTASHSQNWENYENILKDVLRQSIEHGRALANAEWSWSKHTGPYGS